MEIEIVPLGTRLGEGGGDLEPEKEGRKMVWF